MNFKVRIAILSVSVNVLLVVVKLLLARWSNSNSIFADAIHSLSDILVSLLVLSGLILSSLGQKNHAVRWRKIEDIVAIVVGIFILLAAVQIFSGSVGEPPRELVRLPLALAGIFLCILVSGFIARLKLRVGERHASMSLVADGYHSRMDMYSSIGVFIGLIGGMIGLNLDVQAAGLISLLIAITGLEVIVGGVRALFRGTAIEEYWLAILLGGSRRGEDTDSLLGQRSLRVFAWLRRWSRGFIISLAVILALVWFSSGIYRVDPGERALEFRFGRLLPSSDKGPGMHVHLPWPIDTVRKTSLEAIRRVEIGFRTQPEAKGTSVRSYQWESRHVQGRYSKRPEESIVFTGDENLIDVNTTVQYRVAEATSYLLNVENPEGLVRSAAQEAIRKTVGMETLDALFTTDRVAVEKEILKVLQATMDRTNSGVEVTSVSLQDVHPPVEVVDYFRDVASAREDKNRLINQAFAYRNEVLPRARGRGYEQIQMARADKQERVDRATGEAERFTAILGEYRKAPNVTEVRLFLEVVEQTLPGLEKFIVEPGASREPLDLRFFNDQSESVMGGAEK